MKPDQSKQQEPALELDSKKLVSDLLKDVKDEGRPEKPEIPPAAEPTKPIEPATPPKKPDDKKGEPPAVDVNVFMANAEKPDDKKPKPTPAPEEPEPDEIKAANQKVRHAFAQIRTKAAQLQEELNKAKSAQPAPQSQPAGQIAEQLLQNKNIIDQLQAQLNKAYDEIGKFSLEADPRFKAKYSAKQEDILEQVKDTLKEWEIKDSDVVELIKATPKERIDLLNEKAPDAMAVIAPMLTQYDHYERLKRMEIEKYKETKQALEMEYATAKEQADRAGRTEMFKQAAMKVLQDGHTILQPVEGNEEWNHNVSILHQQIRGLFEKDDPLAQSHSMILGVIAPIYKKLYENTAEKLKGVEKEMKERYGAKPSLDATLVGGNQKPKDAAQTADDIVRGVLASEGR